MSISSFNFLFGVQVSLLYKNMLSMYTLNSLHLTFRDIFFVSRIFLYLMYDAIESCFLLLMSSLVPNSVPKYLHFLHSLLEFFDTLYFSVFSLLIIKFLFLSFLMSSFT